MAFRSLPQLACLLVLFLGAACAHADTPIKLLESYAGNVNFVGTQKTIRNRSNGNPCEVFNQGTERTAELSGIPTGASILAAHLYWAGSRKNPDLTVTFEGKTVTAAANRRYDSTTIGNNFNYFSGAANVTDQVRKKRNGTYTFRGLAVENKAPYCAVEGVLGGFSLLVIYEDSGQPFRVLNLYEGFQFMRNTGFTLNLGNFRIPSPLGSATGRVGHISWEGDDTLGQNGENLKFNDAEMTDSFNPSGNQFNSKSNINGDSASYGIDFDAYTLSSPVIQAGQTTATTHYESGQDLVLLSAEIIALPNVPAADLGVSLKRNNEMTLGQNVSYTVSVTNYGPRTDTGPIVVATTLPSGLAFMGGAGTGWACSSTGQLVTCSNASSMPAGSTLPALTLTAQVKATGTITAAVSVSGKMFDHIAGNNVASATGSVTEGGQNFMLTDDRCVAGVEFGKSGQTCTTALGPIVAGEVRKFYITAVSDGVPQALSKTKDTDVSMEFALSCHNPKKTANVKAVFATVTLEPCASDGATPTVWSKSKATVTLTKGLASVAADFVYQDVGEIQLFMRQTGVVGTGVPFTSVPSEIRLSDLKVGNATPQQDEPSDTGKFLIAAGAPFSLTVGAYSTTGALTPNFGNEDDPVKFQLPTWSIGATSSGGTKAMTHDEQSYVQPVLTGSFGAPTGGKATSDFSWSDVGLINLTPAILPDKYLGIDVKLTPLRAGRFVPSHFVTEPSERMPCTERMLACADDVAGAAYSREKFPVRITARNRAGGIVTNYREVFARPVKLSAVRAAGQLDAMPGLSADDVPAAAFFDGVAEAKPALSLAIAFDHTKPQARPSSPANIYLRAAESAGDGVTSMLADDPLREGGIHIVSGRLLVPNAHGSERLLLPLKVAAQYWSGTAWEASSSDNHSLVDPAITARTGFSGFAGGMSANKLTLLPGAPQMLVAGKAAFKVKVNPAVAGSADLLLDSLDYLPSTRGRLKFGVHKSPLIYVRELH